MRVAELARQTVAHCGGSPSFASTRALALATVTLADDYIKAKSAAEAAEAKCRALEAELAALRDRQTQNNGKHPESQPQMRNKVELLAPAGSPEGIRAFAVQSGAGAVYMGFGMFNARRNAQGFSHDEMADAIAYRRARDVKPISHSTFLRATASLRMHSRTQNSCTKQARTRLSCRIWGWRGSSTHTRRISRCTPPRR